jgi:hypothetical protein
MRFWITTTFVWSPFADAVANALLSADSLATRAASRVVICFSAAAAYRQSNAGFGMDGGGVEGVGPPCDHGDVGVFGSVAPVEFAAAAPGAFGASVVGGTHGCGAWP